MDRYKALYDVMVENGELRIVFPKMTGQWEKDKKVFTDKQKELQDILGTDINE